MSEQKHINQAFAPAPPTQHANTVMAYPSAPFTATNGPLQTPAALYQQQQLKQQQQDQQEHKQQQPSTQIATIPAASAPAQAITAAVATAAVTATTPSKGRGRPLGSKNRKKRIEAAEPSNEPPVKRPAGSCAHCGKVFPNRNQLKQHMTVHSFSKPWMCPVCSKTFKRKGACKTHIHKLHGPTVASSL